MRTSAETRIDESLGPTITQDPDGTYTASGDPGDVVSVFTAFCGMVDQEQEEEE
jgi:hypothetical protein